MKPNELVFDEAEFKNVVKNSKSVSDLCRWYKKPRNGYYKKLFDKWIYKFSCDISHFNKVEMVDLMCENDNCNKHFTVKKADVDKGRRFCSVKCSNTKLKRGKLLNFKRDDELTGKQKHKRICFRHHKKECVVCGEKCVVTVHHYNENHDDDRPENLVPVCANHHAYLHSYNLKHLIIDKINNYVKMFVETRAK